MKTINNFNLQILAILFALIPSLLLIAAQDPIKLVRFTEYAEIQKGAAAVISWKFQNAKTVKISGIDAVYGAVDSVSLSPEKTGFYTITAYQGKKDSLKLNFIVNVIAGKDESKPEQPEIASKPLQTPGQPKEEDLEDFKEPQAQSKSEKSTDSDIIQNVQRGPVVYKHKKLAASFEKTGYLNGFAKATPVAQPKLLKIMRTINPLDNQQFLIRALALDEYGNYLSGLGLFEDVVWSIGRKSGTINDKKDLEEFFEQPFADSIHLDIGIALDNSAASGQHVEILNQIKEFIQYLSPEDNLFFSAYNQNYLQMFALSPPEKALWEFDNLTLNKSEGLNALHKAAFKSIEKLGDGFYEDRICIIITFNSDDASIIYTANDVAEIARESQTPVYIIAVGNSVETYSLNFIAHAAGGKFYHVLENEIEQIKNILIEIALSHKAYYEFSVPVNDLKDNDEIAIDLKLKTKKSELITKTNLILKPKLIPVKYQVVANFDYKESFIRTDYEDMLNSLAYLLTNNPGYTIQLIGHSGNEGNDKECYDLSVQRAENVKAYLMSQQIPEHQIKINGAGNHKPLYYLQQTDWQQAYNRRVEIKWLDEELKPYEIAADIYESQGEAEKALKFWDDNGFKAYFDRLIINDKALYEVKVWGYGTLEQAEKAAAKINSKFGKKVKVE